MPKAQTHTVKVNHKKGTNNQLLEKNFNLLPWDTGNGEKDILIFFF